jgi:hypothetical protein
LGDISLDFHQIDYSFKQKSHYCARSRIEVFGIPRDRWGETANHLANPVLTNLTIHAQFVHPNTAELCNLYRVGFGSWFRRKILFCCFRFEFARTDRRTHQKPTVNGRINQTVRNFWTHLIRISSLISLPLWIFKRPHFGIPYDPANILRTVRGTSGETADLDCPSLKLRRSSLALDCSRSRSN